MNRVHEWVVRQYQRASGNYNQSLQRGEEYSKPNGLKNFQFDKTNLFQELIATKILIW